MEGGGWRVESEAWRVEGGKKAAWMPLHWLLDLELVIADLVNPFITSLYLLIPPNAF